MQHKKVISLFIILLMSLVLFGCLGSKSDKKLGIVVNHEIYEYDKVNHLSGNKTENNNIKYGKTYKLVFSLEFTNLEETLGKKIITPTIHVELGVLDNELNRRIQEFEKADGGGFDFSGLGDGHYTNSFNLSKKGTNINFEATYFILELEQNFSPNGSELAPVKVYFSNIEQGYEVNSQSQYEFHLTPTKGDYDFDQSAITTELGLNAMKTNMSIAIPKASGQILLQIFSNETKFEKYGETKFLDSDPLYEENFKNRKLNIILSEIMKQYIGEERYDEWTSIGDFKVYIVITLIGGLNYNDKSVSFEYTFEG